MADVPKMRYRRFGKTELRMPVLTCGGMRYQQAWQDIEPDALDAEKQENLEATVKRAVELGINHIETARGYGSSEYQLGHVLPTLPRESLIVQTKVPPKDNADDFLRIFEKSLNYLQLDYVDLLGIHGINTIDLLGKTLRQGTLKAVRRLQDEGVVRHVGFSTHAGPRTVTAAVESDEFAYVNVHWYYMDQRNWPAIEAATARDMGVFIISPNDKGGKLYAPPPKLVELCRPLTPMAFNALFCLSHPQVHTLSIGASRPTDFDAHLEAVARLDEAEQVLAPILERLEAAAVDALGADWMARWADGLPPHQAVPGEVPLYHVLRLYTLATAFDMLDYARMRYNLLGSGGHWFPGNKVDKLVWEALPTALGDYPFTDRLPAILREAHARFNAQDEKRLSESG